MNYRHAFHAGNHTEVFKHAVLTIVLDRLLQKDKPLMVLDTHAGIGAYDLNSDEAIRTGEKNEGVAKIFGLQLKSAPKYTEILHATNPHSLDFYPGSPEIIRSMLREKDRMEACELHPTDFKALKRRYRFDNRVSTHNRDGYEAISALLPPRERRGLVFIDPPFELRTETDLLVNALAMGKKKWSTGVNIAWYPIKNSDVGSRIAKAILAVGFQKLLQAEFVPYGKGTLLGGGIIICNTPWKVDEQIRDLCVELSGHLGDGGGYWSVNWLAE